MDATCIVECTQLAAEVAKAPDMRYSAENQFEAGQIMPEIERPQIYLITPPDLSLQTFPGQLADVLDKAEIACIRLALPGRDADMIGRVADACRQVAHEHDVAMVIENHVAMVEPHGLDGKCRGHRWHWQSRCL